MLNLGFSPIAHEFMAQPIQMYQAKHLQGGGATF